MSITINKAWGSYSIPTDSFYALRPAGTANNPKKYDHRLLVVYDAPFENDVENGELHSYRPGHSMLVNTPEWRKPTVPTETIDRLLSVSGFDTWDKVTIAWQFHSLDELSTGLVDRAFEAFDARLKFYVKKLNPTAILFMGDGPLVNEARKRGKKFPVGRVFQFEGIDAVWTVPAPPLCVSDPGTSSLLGQAMDHAMSVCRGKNRYTAREADSTTVYCDTIALVKAALKKCMASPVTAYDTEGANLNRISNTLLSVQLAIAGEAFFIPVSHVDSPFGGESLVEVMALLRDFFHKYDGTIVTAHGKYDLIMARNILKVPHMRFKLYDVAAAAFAIDENSKFYSNITSWQRAYIKADNVSAKEGGKNQGRNNISAWSLERTEQDYGIERPSDILGKDQRTDMASVPLEQIVPYGILDVVNLLLIMEQQIKLGKRRGFPDFQGYVEHLGVMIHVFASMEVRGLPTDVNELIALRKPDGPVRKAIREAKKELMASEAAALANSLLLRKVGAPKKSLWGDAAGAWVFNPDKDESQQVIFFDVLRLKGFGVTATGKRSVGKVFLKNNAAHPVVSSFASYVEAKKFKSGFVDSFAAIISTNEDARLTKRIRSSYSFLPVLTGRTASSDPNLQNLPAHGKLAKYIKRVTAAELGYGLIKQDFGQNEIRGYAIISKDSAYAGKFWSSILMHKAYRVATDPADIEFLHKEWDTKGDTHVQAVFDFFGQRVNKKHPLRQAVKAVIFGVLYGKSAKSLALELALVEVKTLREELSNLRADNDNGTEQKKAA